MTGTLRVVVANPLSEENLALLRRLEPRLDVVHDAELTGPASDDWMAQFERPAALQPAYEEYVDSADALYGVPDQSGRALARTVAANPGLRWVHTIPAGWRAAGARGAPRPRGAGPHPVHDVGRGPRRAARGVRGLRRARRREAASLDARGAAPARVGAAPRDADRARPHGRDRRPRIDRAGHRGQARRARLPRRRRASPRRSRCRASREVYGVDRLAEVAALADALVLALPGTDETEKMLSREVLAAAKPGITIVNVGRGTTVDEPALIDALADGRIGLAVLDVTYSEPLAADSPLWDLPNVRDRPAHGRDQPARAAPDHRAVRRQRAAPARRRGTAQPRGHGRVLLKAPWSP